LGKLKGTKQGEIKVFKDKGVAKAYMWKMEDSKWEEIGEVVTGNSESSNMGAVSVTKHFPGDALFPAGEYDHIFDVELGDGLMRKLPFNNGANPYQAADKFMSREGLGRANVE
jgi:phospholipase A-2-activating protein